MIKFEPEHTYVGITKKLLEKMDKLLLKRIFRGPSYTIGKLYLNDTYICDTLEDVDRDKNKNGVFDSGEYKIPNETAIPNGNYGIEFRISPKFSPQFNNLPMPYITGLSTHSYVLIHWGNGPEHTSGCILVGENKIKGRLINSRATFKKLYDLINGKFISLTIE